MKILHIAPTPFFADRGCHMRILGEIRALQALGYEIVLTTYHIGRNMENLKIRRIINVPWYKKLDAGASWHKIYLDVMLLLKSIRICITERPAIIHGHLHEGALIGKVVSWFLSGGKIPVIFDVQGSLSGELETYGFFNNLKFLKPVFKCIERLICKLPDYFVCSSDSNTNFIKSHMKVPQDKVVSVRDGIDADFFVCRRNGLLKKQLGIPERKKIVIYTGSLIWSKGIDHLLEAIQEFAGESGDAHFLIVGYPLEPSLSKASELGVERIVSFTDKVDFFKLPQYLAIADVAVDPKIDEAGEASGKIINYMGAGLPVVCFDTLNNRALLGQNGVYAQPGNPKDLANKMMEALSEQIPAKQIGERNRKRALENFSWKSSAHELHQVYLRASNSK
jgi:glycosyltransferase involved in cell wall biosynthesis